MNPTDEAVSIAIKTARKTYERLPETTCQQRTCCCAAGCPNMYYSEFMSLREGFVERLPSPARIELTVECVRRYLARQKDEKGKLAQKPCVFLKGKECAAYPVRHLKCRLYGLIPPGMYKDNASAVAEYMGVKEEDVPLCQQCPFVKVTPEFQNQFPCDKVPKQMIVDMERELRQVDRVLLGMPPKLQDDGYGFLTYHDWHIMYEIGPEWMEKLTPMREKLNDRDKEQFVQVLVGALGLR